MKDRVYVYHNADLYLIRFLSNLLRGDNHPLVNREQHIHYIEVAI
jgi:hypothetical protein